MRVDWLQIGAVVVMLIWVHSIYNYPLPFDASTPLSLIVSIVLFVAYIYLGRSLFRLPFALNMTWRRYRHARQHHQLDVRAALFDGFYRGFLDRRRWQSGVLAVVDRLVLLVIVLIACLPVIGSLLVAVGGVLGAGLMLLIYIYSGRFALLIDDGLQADDNPFANLR